MKSLKTHQEQGTENSYDRFSELPDELILYILTRIHEVKFICWFLLISKRFFSLISNAKIQNLSFQVRIPFDHNTITHTTLVSLSQFFHVSLVPSIRVLIGKENVQDVFALESASWGSLNTNYLDDFPFRKVINSKFLRPHLNFITNVNVQIPLEKKSIKFYPIAKWKAECWKRCSFPMIVMLVGCMKSLHARSQTLGQQHECFPINVMAPWNIIFDTDLRIRYEVVKKFLRWFPSLLHAQVQDLEETGKLIVKEDWCRGMRNEELVEDNGFEFSHQHVHEKVVTIPEYQCFLKPVRVFLYKLNGEDLDDESIVSNAFEGVFSKAINVVWTEGVICKTISRSLENL